VAGRPATPEDSNESFRSPDHTCRPHPLDNTAQGRRPGTGERKVAKEPVYKSNPKYCLLVFGPEAKTRVWLVQDGDTLYVDRNGNGDLTEAGEKVQAPP
jgi:hypothetical protein